MPQSPTDVLNSALNQRYARVVDDLFRLVAEGRPFSGHERHCVFLNTGGRQFGTISAISGLDVLDDGRGLVSVDWDFDGDLDLWTSNRSAPQVRYFRNDTPGDHHYLAVRLQGRTCNRDAIGARLLLTVDSEAGKESMTLARTLRAGSGFLSQSSKSLHFGLGRHDRVRNLVVRWPDGYEETFTGLQVDRRYKITQGMPEAQLLTPIRPDVPLSASQVDARSPTDAARVVLERPVLMPRLTYRDFAGRAVSWNEDIKHPSLINLWASWCQPCLTEIGEMTDRRQDIRAANLNITALSVDGLDETKPTTVEDAEELLAKLSFPFASGVADTELVDKLQILHNTLFFHRIRLPVPTSLLVDANGHLRVVYRGRIDIDRLLDDVRKLRTDGDEATKPAAGKWYVQPPPLGNDQIAERYEQAGYLDDAVRYQRALVRARPRDGSAHFQLGVLLEKQSQWQSALQSYERALEINEDDANALFGRANMQRRLGQLDQAVSSYRSALRIDPDLAGAHNNLGDVLEAEGLHEEAMAEFRKALVIDPQLADAHFNLFKALIRSGNGDLDTLHHHLEQTVNGKPDFAPGHYHLATVLKLQGQTEEAARHYGQAVELNPDFFEARVNLGVLYARQGDMTKAIEQFERSVQIRPESIEARQNLASALHVQGKLDKAVEHYRKTLALDSDNVTALHGLAELLVSHSDPAQRRPREAIELAKQAAELTGHRNATVLRTLAKAYTADGQQGKARRIDRRIKKIEQQE